MTRDLISSGSKYEALAGYSRAVRQGDWVFVSGTVGFDPSTGRLPDTVEEQTEQTFRNIAAALAQAGSSLAEVVRVRVYVPDRADVERVSRIVGRHFAGTRPANTTICSPLTYPEMKVEIEVTALRLTAQG